MGKILLGVGLVDGTDVEEIDSSNGWVRRRRLEGGGLESLLSSL